MQLNIDDVREFATLWEKEFHETLSNGEAKHLATQLMGLYELLVRTPPGGEMDMPTSADLAGP